MTRLGGIDIIPGEMYVVELIEPKRGGIVEAYISRRVGARRALCPYTNFDAFYANWEVVLRSI